jgi:hypothetical protein
MKWHTDFVATWTIRSVLDRVKTKGRNCHMTIEAHLATLEKKHFALEEELHAAVTRPSSEDQTIAEIKRRKLRIKDEIERLRSAH